MMPAQHPNAIATAAANAPIKPVMLYVEDDPMSRKVMVLCLKIRMKLPQYTIFEDSVDFLARLQALSPRPEVIFLDIHMKPHSGFEMLAMLRGLDAFKTVPVIALTASVMNEEVMLLRTSGFDGCLAKPLDMEGFPDQLMRIMQGERPWRIT